MTLLNVQVACGAGEVELLIDVTLPRGSRVADAIVAADILARAGIARDDASFAIFGQRARPDTPLAEGDRVEVLQALRADPKLARRKRAKDHPLPRSQPKAKQR